VTKQPHFAMFRIDKILYTLKDLLYQTVATNGVINMPAHLFRKNITASVVFFIIIGYNHTEAVI